MGAVRKPSDKGRIDELDDLSPDVRDAVKKLLENLRDKDFERKLTDLIGSKRSSKFLERK